MWGRPQRVNICKTDTRHTEWTHVRQTIHTHTGWGEYTWDSLRVICCLGHQSNKERRKVQWRQDCCAHALRWLNEAGSQSMARQGRFGADCQHAYIHAVYEHVLLWNVKPDPWLLPYTVCYMHLLARQYDISWGLCHTERVIDLHQLFTVRIPYHPWPRAIWNSGEKLP